MKKYKCYKCHEDTKFLYTENNSDYFACPKCNSVFVWHFMTGTLSEIIMEHEFNPFLGCNNKEVGPVPNQPEKKIFKSSKWLD